MAKRAAAKVAVESHGLSERRACQLVGLHRSTMQYRAKKKDETSKRRPGRPSDGINREKTTLYLPSGLVGKLREYAYWERRTIGGTVELSLSKLLVGFKTRPKAK